MSDTIVWIGVAVSISSVLATTILTYLTYFRSGKIIISRPPYIGARQLYQAEIDLALQGVEPQSIHTQGIFGSPNPVQDLIFIPLSVFTTGAKQRALRFKMILNDTHVYHGNYDLNITKLSAIKNPASFLLPASGNIIIPKQGFFKVLCFSQQPLMANLKEPLSLDLWYEERGDWYKGFRIKWYEWPKLKATFDNFSYVASSENFDFKAEFTPRYSKDILSK